EPLAAGAAGSGRGTGCGGLAREDARMTAGSDPIAEGEPDPSNDCPSEREGIRSCPVDRTRSPHQVGRAVLTISTVKVYDQTPNMFTRTFHPRQFLRSVYGTE